MKQKHTHITIREIGNSVFCDMCNDDYTNSNESGGFLFGSYAYCPKCAKRSIWNIRRQGEAKFIKAYCPAGMSYAAWCLQLRGGDNTIKTITTGDEP